VTILHELLAASRPLSWVNTALPFAAGAFAVLGEVTPALVLGSLYFLLPYNLLMYGVNDIHDYASDVANPRKGSAEGALVPPSRARLMWWAIGVTNVPLVLAVGWLAGLPALLAFLVTALVAWLYSAPPLRTKERPILDSFTSALHFVLPAICGLLVAGLPLSELPWGLLVAFTGWGVASHAVGAVQDITYDRAAGIGSVATALGARGVAVLAMAGYGAAVVIVASHGDAGLFAAAWLALYLVLPLMLLAEPSERQARLAWQTFLGLNLLVGFVLTHLLLRAWGVTGFSLTELLVALALLPAAFVLVNALLSLLVLRRPLPARTDDGTSVTVVVPCRDDAARLLAVLPALTGQRHAGTRVLVMDAGSVDGSMTLAEGLLEDRGEVRSAGAPSSIWDVRAWAAWHAAQASDSDWLLFTDTETILEAHAAGALVEAARAAGADLVTGMPRVTAEARGERIAAPGFGLLLHGFLPLWLLARRRGRPGALSFAAGQLLLVRRETYLGTGGHAAFRASGRPEVEIARAVVSAGGRVAIVHGADLARTRLAPDLAAAFALWRRALLAHAGGSAAMALTAIIGTWLAWGLPLVLPVIGLVSGDTGLLAGGLVALTLMLTARLFVALLGGEDTRALAWHPLTAFLTPILQLGGLGAALLRPGGSAEQRHPPLAAAGAAHPSGPSAR
jgi:4-hydroxybenzoate polyprenyltransferase